MIKRIYFKHLLPQASDMVPKENNIDGSICINVLQNLTQRLQPWPVLVILFNFLIIEQDVVFDILTD